MKPLEQQPSLWGRLAGHSAAPQQPGLWAALGQRADPTLYRPQAIPDLAEEQVREGEQELTVIRSPRGAYLRLTPEQRAVWHQMDGTRTIGQLATNAFLHFHQLLPVGDLVATLRREGFLADQPVGVYGAVAAHMEAHTAEGWGRRLLRVLTGQRFEFRSIDGFYSAMFRAGGWLLFTPLFLALWLLVALAGGGAFVALLLAGGSANAGAGLPLQIAALWLALLLSFLLHESAHALAVKQFGRTLRGGGLMLYFGAPAFYVDTSDIWRSSRRARVLVSAAGPMSDLFIGGLAALLAFFQPEAAFAAVAWKLAFTCYIATLFNLNPLLELDGYYILVDLLRLPDLRRRALAFVGGPLWGRLKPKGTSTSALSPQPSALSREERIFTLYGLLATLYTVIALVFAVQFWQRWVWGSVVNLWASGLLLNQVVAAAIVLLVVAPVGIGLGFAAWGTVRGAVAWLIRNGYGRRPDLVAVACAAVALLLALGFGGGAGPLLGQLLPLLLWGVATAALLYVLPDYRNAAIAPTMDALVPATVLAGLASLVRVWLPTSWLWQLADGGALLFLLIAAFNAQLDVNVRQIPPRIQLMTAILLTLSFGFGGLVLANQLGSQLPLSAAAFSTATPWAILIAAPAFFGALALALLLPYLHSLSDSRLVWSWALLWGAALAQTMAYVADLRTPSLGLDVLSAGLWAAAWITHLATLRQIAPAELTWQHTASLSEPERLQRAFQLAYAGCYQLLRAVYGGRRTRELDDRMDVLAATANWDVRLDRDQAEIGMRLAALPLDRQGARFAEVLRYTVATIEEIAGQSFARRCIQAAYDALPWPERETAGRLCFPDTPWARALSQNFGGARQA
ncbi:MAG: cyclic nucleotide-binding protein, partial [Roseiflexaceae bacterium]|nr:cyclic nucleotide-binding protein [Roseiflexaceae bacterium]